MRTLLAAALAATIAPTLWAQAPTISAADYDRARGLQARYRNLAVDVIDNPTWISNSRFWYRKSVNGGNVFVAVDATNPDSPQRAPAFDHDRLAAGLSATSGAQVTAITLPFTSFTFTNNGQAIATYCLGQAASMGAFLLAGGVKGKRFALPNARIMIHQPHGGASGQATDIEIQAREILRLRETLNGIMAKHSGRTVDEILKDTDRDNFMSADEAKHYGLVDEVLRREDDPGPPQPKDKE
jgi:hypothetical protein